MAFPIEEGVVKISADVDRSSLTKAARSAGDAAGEETEKAFRKGFSRSSQSGKAEVGGIIRKLFTPDADAFASLRAPFAAALSTPVGAAAVVIAGVFAAAFGAALITAVAGLGIGSLFIGLGVLALKEVKPLVREFESLKKTISEVGREAAGPLLKPFIGALRDIKALVKDLAPDFRSIFTSLAPVIPMLTEGLGGFASEVIGGLKDSMPGIVAAFKGFSDALPIVGKALGDFFRTIFENDELIDNTTKAVTLLVTGPLSLLGPIISVLTVAFGYWNNLLTYLGQVLPGVNSEVNTMWEAIGLLASEFFEFGPAIDRIKEAWGPLGAAIQDVWNKIKAFAGEDDASKLQQRMDDLVQSLKDAWTSLKEFAKVVWTEVWGSIQKAWNEKVVPWWNDTAKPWLKDQLGAAFEEAFEAIKQKVENKLGSMVETAKNKIKAMGAALILELTGLPGRAVSALAALPGRVGEQIGKAAAQALTQAKKIVSNVVDKVGEIKGKVIGKLSGAGSWLYNAGHSIMTGLLNGIKQAWENVAGYLSGLAAKIKNLKGPIEKDRQMLVPEGQAIMDSLMTGLSSRFGGLAKMLSGLTGDIPAMVGGGQRFAASAAPGSFAPAASPAPSSPASMAPSFTVNVSISPEKIKELARVEIRENDRTLGAQVSAGTGGFRL